MSYADKVFVAMCQDILENGTSTEGELVHVIADAHIYDRHVPIVKELIERPQYDAPKFWLNPDIKDFYQFTTDDIKITDYVTGEQIKDIPIAV